MAVSAGMPHDAADKLAAVICGLRSLSDGAARVVGAGGVNQVIIEMHNAYLFVAAISDGSALGVVAGQEPLSSAQAKCNRRLRALEDESALDWSALEGVSVLRRPQGTLSQHFAKRYYLPAETDVTADVGAKA